jgi:AcrR family transcriptional regulator
MAPAPTTPNPVGLPAPKARILAVAADHLQRYGARRITVVGVAEEAGMTHANVYRYFTSKLALLDALTADWLKPLEERLAAAADAPDPAPDKLERMLLAIGRAYRDVMERDPHLFGVFVSAFEESRGVARKHRARVRQLIDRVVEEGIASDAILIRDRRRAATLLLDCSYPFIHPSAIARDGERPVGPEERFERVIAVALAAMTRPRTGAKTHDE